MAVADSASARVNTPNAKALSSLAVDRSPIAILPRFRAASSDVKGAKPDTALVPIAILSVPKPFASVPLATALVPLAAALVPLACAFRPLALALVPLA